LDVDSYRFLARPARGLPKKEMVENQRLLVSDCSEIVAKLVRLWSRKAQSLRLSANADASHAT
jgi:hypothetical protein